MRQLCGVTKSVEEKMKVFSGGSAMWREWKLLMGKPQKRWIDNVKDCLKVKQARRMVHDRSVWRRFVRGNAWGVARGMNP